MSNQGTESYSSISDAESVIVHVLMELVLRVEGWTAECIEKYLAVFYCGVMPPKAIK